MEILRKIIENQAKINFKKLTFRMILKQPGDPAKGRENLDSLEF